MRRKGILVLAVLFLAALIILELGRRGYQEIEAYQSFEKAAAKIRRDFPEVNPLLPRDLAERFENPETVVLIDARDPLEFAVSHLPGAVNLRTVAEVKDHLAARKAVPGTLIVYGAIGFRAAQLADDLLASGFGNVELLEGGIFRWANEDRPLVNAAGGMVMQVHPYNKVYRRLLDPAKRATAAQED
jgi:rhodanese-related sulfurtransferase